MKDHDPSFMEFAKTQFNSALIHSKIHLRRKRRFVADLKKQTKIKRCAKIDVV